MRRAILIFAATLFSQTAFAQVGDAAAGEKVFRKCAACHIAVSETSKLGPHLLNIIDRPVAAVEDYTYSKAILAFGADGKAWDEALLRDYLANPKAIVRGTRMAFAGLRRPKEVDDVIAYLRSVESDAQ